MANNGGNITFGIGFNVDKSGLNDLKKSLQDIQKATTKDLVGDLGGKNAQEALAKVKQSASQIEQALRKAYNPTINATNISKFNQQLSKTGTNLNEVYQDFSKIQGGSVVFTKLASQILTTNVKLKETHSLLDSMGQTMVNTVKWSIASSVMNAFTGSIQNSFNYVKALDSSLTDIRIVTGQSRQEMDRFADSANKAAAELGRQTKEYTNAALTFYQQGLSDEDVQARTEVTLKASNITGQSTENMAEYLTAVWNGYQVAAQNAENYVDKLAAVADSSASNMSELAVAMSKVSSTANAMGVDVDQLSAQIATIIATTRQAPETVGNALKTIYARINDIKAGSDQAEVSLGRYSAKMAQLGFNVLDTNGQLRDTGEVFEQIGNSWANLTKEQQISLAQTMAGQRQYNNLIALFDNWDQYIKELNISLQAQGTLADKNSRYMESLSAHMKQLQAAEEGLIQSFVNGDSFKGFIDFGTDALNLAADLVDSIGGGGTALLALGSIATSVFSGVISKEINSLITNFQNAKFNAEQLNQVIAQTKAMASVEGISNNTAIEAMIKAQKDIQKYYSVMTGDQINYQNNLIKQLGLAQQRKALWEEQNNAAQNYANTLLKGSDASFELFSKDEYSLGQLQDRLVEVNTKLKETQTVFKSINSISFGEVPKENIKALKTEVQELLKVTNAADPNSNKIRQLLQLIKEDGQVDQKTFYSLRTAVRSFLDETEGSQNLLAAKLQEDSIVAKQFESDVDNIKQALQESRKSFEQSFNIDGLVRAISAIGQITAGIQGLSNILDIFQDKKLSGMEKFEKVLLNLTSSLPMIILGFKQLNFTMGITSTLQVLFSKSVAANTVAMQANSAAVAGSVTQDAAAATSKGILAGAMNLATSAATKFNLALSANPMGAIIVLGTVLIGTIYGIAKAYDAINVSAEEAAESLSSSLENYKDENNKIEDLNTRLNQVASKIDEIESKGPIQITEESQLIELKAQNAELEAQISLQKELQKLAEQQVARDARQAALKDSYANSLNTPIFQDQAELFNGSPQLAQDHYTYSASVGRGWFNNKSVTAQLPGQVKITQDITKISAQDTKGFNTWTQQMTAAIQYAQNELQKYQGESTEEANAWVTAWTYILEQLLDEQQRYSEGWQEARSEALKTAEENKNIALEVLPALLNTNIKGQNDAAISYYSQKVKQYYEITGMWDQAVKAMAQTALSSQDRKKLIETIRQNQGKVNLDQLQDSLGKEVFEKINLAAQSLGVQLEDLASDYYKLMTAADAATESMETPQPLVPSDIGGFRSNLEKYQKGTLKDDDLKQFETILNSLQDAYPSLIDKVQTLKNNWLAGTDEYKEALSAIEDTLSYNMINATMQASEAAADAWDKIFHEQEEFVEGSGIPVWDENGQPLYKAEVDLQLDDEEVAQFQEQLNTILDAEHSIDVEIHTDAEQAFEGIQSKFDQISAAAQKIGQGFIVAADDMRELNNVFPGIMQGMQMLENGTFQLNEDIVKSVTNATMAEAAAEAESVRQRLQSQAELLHAKAQSYQTIANAAAKLASSEVQSSEESASLQGTISKELSNLKQINSQLAATKENADQKAVADSSQANAGVMANNWAGAANSAAQSIYQFAANAAHNMKAVAEGNPDAVTPPGNISSIFSGGQSGVDQQLSAIESAENTINAGDASKEAFADMAAQFQAMADASEQAANDIDGMLAQIGGNVNDIVTGIQDVQAGKAYGSTQKDTGSKKSGGGGSKKGSGSGKDKTKSADQIEKKKLKDDQIDKYHELDRAIKDVQETIDDLNRAEGKTVRNGLSQTIDQQVAALEQQKGLYEQKLGLMQADLQMMQANLSALGVQFDEQGNIINYTSLMIEYQSVYNQLLEEAKLLTGDEQQAKLNEAEAVKAKLDALKSQMGAYEQLQDKIVDAGNAIQDILDKEEELRIKQFKIKIDTELDKAQAQRDWNEFRKKVIDQIKDDDYVGQARARLQDFHSYYKPDGGGIIQELTEHVNRTRQEAEIIENGGVSSIYGENEAQALEDLKHYNEQLMQSLEDVEDLIQEIQDLYLDTIDKAKDAFDEQIDTYEQIDSIIQHDLNLIQMLDPTNNEEQLARYYQMRAENNNKEIDFYRRQKEMWKELMDAAEQGSEDWKKFRDNWMESVSSMNDAVERAVENLLDKYHNTIQKIIREAKDQVLGGDWQKALDEWDRAKWLDDRYLDIGTRATGVLDFVTDVNKAMEGMPVKQQQDLLKFMNAEVDRLNNMTRLRQVDLDIANKKLEVLQKQMALEETQESKTRLRLRRDSQGNYTYQYVADEDQIATKEQQLRDTLEELRQLAKVDVSDTIDAVQEKLQEFFDKAQELSQTYYNDEETLKQKLLELQEQYFGEEGYLTLLGIDYNEMQGELLEATGAQFTALYAQQKDELKKFLGLDDGSENSESVWGSIMTLIGADEGKIPTLLNTFTTSVIPDNFKKISDENKKLLFLEGGLNPSWDTALGNVGVALGNTGNEYQTFGRKVRDITKDVIVPAIKGIVDATDIYKTDLGYLQIAAGQSFGTIKFGLDQDLIATKDLTRDNEALVNTYKNEVTAAQAVVAQLGNLVQKYGAARDAAIEAAAAATAFWMAALGRGVSGSTPSFSPSSGGAARAGGTPSSSSSGSNSGSGGSGGGGKTVTYSATVSGPSGGGQLGATSKPTSVNLMHAFATGGYTGEWTNGDEEGRVALLHQKELVLNADDTKNILSAVDIVRGIMRSVSGLNMAMQDGLPSTGRFSSLTNNNNNGMNQSVIINADFPAVSDAQEIKQAFNNLINIASQKASGNRRTY